MGRRESESRNEERREADWKASLAEIRSGLPIYRDRPVSHSPKSSKYEKQGKDRELLLALCERQDWKCFWCGSRMSDGDPADPSYRTLEHVVGRSSRLGIVNHLSNLRAACRACNEMRAQMQHMKSIVARMERYREMVAEAQNTLARHHVTMAGRCYYCKLRFHILEWWHKTKAKYC